MMIKNLLLVGVLSTIFAFEVVAETSATPMPKTITETSTETSTEVTKPVQARRASYYDGPGFYIGTKVSSASMSNSAYEHANNLGLYGGYQMKSWLAVEVEYNHKVNSSDINYHGINGEYNLDTLAVYVALSTKKTKRVYFKGRVGLSAQRVLHKTEDSFFKVADDGHVNYYGISLSPGIGINLTNSFALEGEATILGSVDNTALMISLGLKYKF